MNNFLIIHCWAGFDQVPIRRKSLSHQSHQCLASSCQKQLGAGGQWDPLRGPDLQVSCSCCWSSKRCKVRDAPCHPRHAMNISEQSFCCCPFPIPSSSVVTFKITLPFFHKKSFNKHLTALCCQWMAALQSIDTEAQNNREGRMCMFFSLDFTLPPSMVRAVFWPCGSFKRKRVFMRFLLSFQP